MRPYLAEVVSSVCGDDVELCAACVLRGMEFLSLPDQTINDIIESCHRSDGERYFFNKSKEENYGFYLGISIEIHFSID